jgi:hypothetical protein
MFFLLNTCGSPVAHACNHACGVEHLLHPSSTLGLIDPVQQVLLAPLSVIQ